MIHIIPINDIREHRLDTTCDCEAEVEFDRQIVATHNSFDGREDYATPDPKKPWMVFEGDDDVLTGVLAADGEMVPVEEDE